MPYNVQSISTYKWIDIYELLGTLWRLKIAVTGVSTIIYGLGEKIKPWKTEVFEYDMCLKVGESQLSSLFGRL